MAASAAKIVPPHILMRKRLPPLPSTRDILKLYKLTAQKRLAQNFLLDPAITRRIARAAGKLEGTHVCEVGPGPGSITRAILELGAQHVTVIEKDKRFVPCLELLQEACRGHMEIKMGCVMEEQFHNMFPQELARPWEEACPKIHLIGNLPFNVATPLIIRWLFALSERRGVFKYGRVRMTLTFQREVAERIVAVPGHEQRCRLSFMAQHLCIPELKFFIPGSACIPPPDVDIGVVKLIPLREPEVKIPFKLVEKVARHLFNCKRKFCRFGVEYLFPQHMLHLADEMFKISEISMEERTINLSNEQLGRLCYAYYVLCKRIPKLIEYDGMQNAVHMVPLSDDEGDDIED